MQRYPAHMLAQLHAGGSLFLYQGPGALLTQLQPGLVSTLNLETTQGIVLLDRAENEVSERRQNKIDTATTDKDGDGGSAACCLPFGHTAGNVSSSSSSAGGDDDA